MPAKYRICPQCHGEGTTVHPALSVWTESDRAADPDGFEDMLTGAYDVPCFRCDGLRVVTAASEWRHRDNRDDRRTRALEDGDREYFLNPY